MRPLLLLIFVASTCAAQDFKKVRVGIGYGRTFGFPGKDNQTSSGVVYFEPSYRVTDKIAIGFRMESAVTGMPGSIGGGSTSINSYGVNSQYYFSNKQFRPFAGMGAGFYKPRITGDGFYGYSSTAEQTVFGFYPRIGFDFGHLILIVDYNIVTLSQATINYGMGSGSSQTTEQRELKNSYGSVKLGLMIGGGRKK